MVFFGFTQCPDLGVQRMRRSIDTLEFKAPDGSVARIEVKAVAALTMLAP